MQLTVQIADICSRVKTTQNVVDKKNTIPVLSNLLLSAKDHHLTLIGTNLETGISTTCPANIQVEGDITIPAQKFFEILSNSSPDDLLKLTVDEKCWIQVNIGKSSKFKLAGLSRQDFPDLPAIEQADAFSLAADTLHDMLNRVLFAVSHDESRYALTGVCLIVKNRILTLVATNGHLLAKVDTPIESDYDYTTIVPLKAMGEIKKMCDDMPVAFYLGDTSLQVQAGETRLFTRVIDAQFPDYTQVIPASTPFTARVNVLEFSTVLRRVALLCSDSRMVACTFTSNRVTLFANDPNLGEAREEMAIEYEGDDLTIGFNSRYLFDVLSAAKSETFTIGLTDNLAPATFSVENSSWQAIVMPMRVK